MAKPNLITTPRGVVAGFCALQTPTWDFKKVNQEYQIKVAFEASEVGDFIENLEALRDAKLAEVLEEKPKYKKVASTLPIGKVELDDEGDETGRILISFKQRYAIHSKKTGETFHKKISLWDSRGKPITTKLNIGTGSVVKVSFEPIAYFMEKDYEAGISFGRMAGVQLIKFVPYSGGGSAKSQGFDVEDEEGGFDASDFAADDDDQTSGDAPGSDEDDF